MNFWAQDLLNFSAQGLVNLSAKGLVNFWAQGLVGAGLGEFLVSCQEWLGEFLPPPGLGEFLFFGPGMTW